MSFWESPQTCEYIWHVFQPRRKRCDCGAKRSPVYRNRFQRWLDKRARRKVARR